MQAYLSKYKDKKKSKKKSVIVSDELEDEKLEDEKLEAPQVDSLFKGFKRVGEGSQGSPQGSPPLSKESLSKESAVEPVSKDSVSNETVFRDLSGKKVDITTMKASTKSSQLVLNPVTEPSRSSKSFTAGKDDKAYNETLKARTGVEDPMRGRAGMDQLEYRNGINGPNRFGIKAGVLWDGIDRGNGFERLVLRKRNETTKVVEEDYEIDAD